MSDILNYEKDINIDEQALDVEWLNQADIMRKYTKHQANAEKKMDEAKERVDVGKAKLERSIRKTPQKYGIDKVTESGVQSTILLQPKYQELMQNFIDAKHEFNIAKAVVRAIDQKKTALENLVKLLGASYFAGPVSPRDLTQETLKEKERKMQNAKVKIQRKK